MMRKIKIILTVSFITILSTAFADTTKVNNALPIPATVKANQKTTATDNVSNAKEQDITPNSIFTNLGAVIAILVSLIPVLAAFGKLSTRRRRRLRIKSDLELLTKLDANDPSHKVVKTYIDQMIIETYKLPTKVKIYHKGEFIGGIILILLTSFISMKFYNRESVWWWILTILYSTNGPFFVISSFLKTSIFRYIFKK